MLQEIWDWDDLLLPYCQTVRELCVKFEAYTSEFGNKSEHSLIESVEGRVKRVGSILEKAARKHIKYSDFNDLSQKVGDIAGIRAICRFEEDIERVVAMIRERNGLDMYILDERDYIKNIKQSGYRSYHIHIRYTVLMRDGPKDVMAEIQIRTMAMNIWASIEHSLKYKYNGVLPEKLKKRLSKSAEVAFLLDHELGVIRDDIIEARKMIERKHDLGDEILRNIMALYRHSPSESVVKLNQEFLSLNENSNLEQLHAFNQRLRRMTQQYAGVEML